MALVMPQITEFGSVNRLTVPALSLAAKSKARRGTSNTNARGNVEDRARRRAWLVETYRADTDLLRIYWPSTNEWTEQSRLPNVQRIADTAEVVPACRCYRCGDLLSVHTVTVDRIIPGCKGGTYRRNNIRPACGGCNSETGGALASIPKKRRL